ncbi:MAG: multicopper oxidase domain-containing protein [Deltaproteobacteria bacterium]|nr:multicopper oxidase domain-containing protein [Deltaproteobacteria bacterium]
MFKRPLRGLLPAALCGLALLWGGLAQAYLSPNYADPSYDPGGGNYPWTPGPGDTPDYLTTPNWAYSPPMRKFVDSLPGLNAPNNLGQQIPVAKPDIVTYPGSDYYVIELVEHAEQMHSDLPPTTLRLYRQVNNGTDTSVCGGAGQPACTTANNTVAPPGVPHYLGPLIVSQKDRPVRVKFINNLPTGAGGDLFVPVDTTVMGSGPFETAYDAVTKLPSGVPGVFAQNRATLHLHGGRTPWISDGTPHQWITPAGEVTDYPTGVSVENVPDMPDPGPGAQTFYWTNQQSARMMFYHDHAWGITRLNVYVGEAAGYLIRDPVEQALVNGGTVGYPDPATGPHFATYAAGTIPADEIPLVIEDKTFVDAATVRLTDPLWNWGTGALDAGTGIRTPNTGDLWWPHVYMPAQNPFDITGIAPMGRWAYGPYFYPATPNPFQPVANPYYSDLCDPAGDAATTPGILGGPYGQFCQPLEIPGTPDVSWGAEAFMDTQTVNGTAYPSVTLAPKPYRFRILNASHDRFLNLQLYVAVSKNGPNTETDVGAPLLCDGATPRPATDCTEVRMLPAAVQPGFPATWPVDGRAGGVPDYTTKGPDWIMIGTEGGFLPKPVVIPPHPVTWNINPSMFNVGNINGGSLMLGPAERADVIVDLSGYAVGTTLILYNDAPAPWPALNPTYDYYTGNPDQQDVGGSPPTLPGYGPNTRTVMQITIDGAGGAAFNLGALQAAFTSHTNTPGGAPSVFQVGQDPIIAAQGDMNTASDPNRFEAFLFPETFDAYTKAYDPPTPFPTSYPNWGISRINDQSINFVGVDGSTTYKSTTTNPRNNTLDMKRKAIHDEMGATWDDYGRMRAGLGLELSNLGPLQVNFIVQTYSDPATEILEENGIQVWKITHNGVDTHPIHFHLYDVQVLNRVGWDGFIRLPDPTELGWKDTVRISPLEDTIVALKPVTPKIPFGVPESYRPLNPATNLGSTAELSTVDPTTGDPWPTPNVNRMYNFDWEYVWHCHILSHEENDMMRAQVFKFQEVLPDAPTGLAVSTAGVLTWTDPTPAAAPATLLSKANEIGFRVERALVTGGVTGTYSKLADTLANATTLTDGTIASAGSSYAYKLIAFNAAGDSPPSNTAQLLACAKPASLWIRTTTSTDTNPVVWGASPTAGASYELQEAQDAAFTVGLRQVYTGLLLTTNVTILNGNGSYYYRVRATAAGYLPSLWVSKGPMTVSNVTAEKPASLWVRSTTPVLINPVVWGTSPTTAVSYEVQQAQNASFTVGLASVYTGTALNTNVTVSANASYYFRVRATKAGYLPSPWVVAGPMVVSAPVVANPASLWVRTTTNVETNPVVWGASSTASVTYEVEEARNSGFSVGLRQVYSGTALTTNVTIQGGNGAYYYRVRATRVGYVSSGWVTTGPMTVVNLTALPPVSIWVRTATGAATNPIIWGASPTVGAAYEAQEAQDAAFTVNMRTVYTGAALNTNATVAASGTYYYRVRATKTGYLPSSWVNSAASVVTLP